MSTHTQEYLDNLQVSLSLIQNKSDFIDEFIQDIDRLHDTKDSTIQKLQCKIN